MPTAAPAQQRYAGIYKTLVKDLEDLNMAPEGLMSKLGVKTKPAEGVPIEGEWMDGFMWNSGNRGFDDYMPSTLAQMDSSTTEAADIRKRRWSLNPVMDYAGIHEYGPVIGLSKFAKGKMGFGLTEVVKNTLAVRAFELDRKIVGDGTGTLATVFELASSGTRQIKVKRHDTLNKRHAGEFGATPLIHKNRVVVAMNPSTGAMIGTAAHRVDDIIQQPDFGYDIIVLKTPLTADVPVNARIVAGDYKANSWGKEPNGLGNIFDTGQNFESFMGISRLDFEKAGLLPGMEFAPTLGEGVDGHFVPVLHGNLKRYLDIYHGATNETGILLFLRESTRREYPYKQEIRQAASGIDDPSEFMARAGQGGGLGSGRFALGEKGTDMYHDAVQVQTVTSIFARPGETLGMKPGMLTNYVFEDWHDLGGYEDGNGGRAVRPTQDKDTNIRFMRQQSNVHCTYPFKSFKAKQQLTQEDVIPQL